MELLSRCNGKTYHLTRGVADPLLVRTLLDVLPTDWFVLDVRRPSTGEDIVTAAHLYHCERVALGAPQNDPAGWQTDRTAAETLLRDGAIQALVIGHIQDGNAIVLASVLVNAIEEVWYDVAELLKLAKSRLDVNAVIVRSPPPALDRILRDLHHFQRQDDGALRLTY